MLLCFLDKYIKKSKFFTDQFSEKERQKWIFFASFNVAMVTNFDFETT